MAKRKINYNAAIDDVKKALEDKCEWLSLDQFEKILAIVESKRRPPATTQGVPDPQDKPPGHGTGGGN